MYDTATSQIKLATLNFLREITAVNTIPTVQKPTIVQLSVASINCGSHAPIQSQNAFLEAFFKPKPLTAVAGASSTRINIGRELLEKLQRQRVPHYAISEKQIPGVETFTSKEAPDPDILLISTPARAVERLISQFPNAAKVVYSAGFEDVGGDSLSGDNFIGPNSVGVVGCNDFTFLSPTFSKTKKFAVVSHSGAVLGALAERGGCGFSIGNATVVGLSDCVDFLSPKFRKVAIYCENDDWRLLGALEAHQDTQFIVLLGGTTESGAKRAVEHTGKRLSAQFIKSLSGAQNVRRVNTLEQLEASCLLNFKSIIPVVESGFCATRAADILPAAELGAEIVQYINALFAAEKIPAKPGAVIDVTPSLSSRGIIDICEKILKHSSHGVLLSVLGDLGEKNSLVSEIEKLKPFGDRVVVSVEGDLKTAAEFEKEGFFTIPGIDQASESILPLVRE